MYAASKLDSVKNKFQILKTMEKVTFNLGITLSAEELSALKGGVAEVSTATQETSRSGDGAEYVCCIKIKFPSKSTIN